MSKEPHTPPAKTEPHHGTAKNYVIGFILSLVFTLIPYYLIVQKSYSETALLVAILAFAFIQLIIQAMFFLHLGRKPSPEFHTYFLIATIGAVMVVIGGSIWIMHHLNSHMELTPTEMKQRLVDDEAIEQVGGEKTGSCKGQHENHRVIIKDGLVSPYLTTAKLCDTLTITNEDDVDREITFGTHPDHGTYAGRDGKKLHKGKSYTFTLSQPGTEQFHDHDRPEAHGNFTVTE
jgi:cytochrome o ubiquinol oxidase operon protein cyoD